MFNPYFNNNFQNTFTDQNMNYDQYQNLPPVNNDETSYMQGMSAMLPQLLPDNAAPNNLMAPYPNAPAVSTYAEGGKVKGSKSKNKNNPYPMLAEMIRQQGQGEDSILAHINPLEALMLKGMGGSGKINPVTGLPQFGFFKNPWKAIRSSLGGAGGAIIGNMILPGIGGVIGGALGQGAQHAARGKSFGEGALKGAAIGSFTPSAASLLGSGASSLGMSSLGSTLSNYGARNAILPSLGINLGGSSGTAAGGSEGFSLSNLISGGGSSGSAASTATSAANKAAVEGSFIDKLTSNTGNFLSKPKNLLTLASVAGSFANRPKPPKEKSPEKLAEEQKRFQQAMILSPQELAAREAAMLAEEQMRRRVERNKFLPEERFAIEPVYRKTNSPEEYKKKGKWLEYYNNPDFSGVQIPFKHGGSPLSKMMYKEEVTESPGLGFLIEGMGGGQDDDIRIDIPENSYIIDASTVSNIGDGNTHAGAEKIKALISNGEYYIPPEGVKAFGKGDTDKGINLLDTLVKNVRKHKGGSTKLPPKAKPLTSYIKR